MTGGTRLNHTGFVHRPGESSLVIELFEALNCRCEQDDSPVFGKFVIVRMGSEPGENDFFATEAEPEHLAFEDILQRQIDTDGSDLAAAHAKYRLMLEERAY